VTAHDLQQLGLVGRTACVALRQREGFRGNILGPIAAGVITQSAFASALALLIEAMNGAARNAEPVRPDVDRFFLRRSRSSPSMT
jgi:hypothetical protein